MAFDTGEIMDRVETGAARTLLRNALTLQAEYKRLLSVMNPPPFLNSSHAGEYLKARTYNARDAVVVEPASLEMIRRQGYVRVGVLLGAWYVALWVGRGWKGIVDCHNGLKAAGRYKELDYGAF